MTGKNENEFIADVYVGCYEYLTYEDFRDLFSTWCYRFRSVHLGYLVIDEFHNVGCQKYRKNVTFGFNVIDTSAFSKIALLSGTIGKNRFGLHLKAFGIFEDVTDQVEASSKIRVFDMVTETPLRNVLKTIQKVETSGIAEAKTIALVNRFLKLFPGEKIIVVCNSRKCVERLGRLTFNGELPIWVHGEFHRDEKLERSREVLGKSRSRVLIGTCLVSEGIDVQDLGVVVLCKYVPSLTEFIQIGGRLRRGGNYFGFWSYTKDNENGFPLYDPTKDANEQIARSYGCGGITIDNDMPEMRSRCDLLLSNAPNPPRFEEEDEDDVLLADESFIEYCSVNKSTAAEPDNSDAPLMTGSISSKDGFCATTKCFRCHSGMIKWSFWDGFVDNDGILSWLLRLPLLLPLLLLFHLPLVTAHPRLPPLLLLLPPVNYLPLLQLPLLHLLPRRLQTQ